MKIEIKMEGGPIKIRIKIGSKMVSPEPVHGKPPIPNWARIAAMNLFGVPTLVGFGHRSLAGFRLKSVHRTP